MARGTQLLALYAMLRNELGKSDSVAVGVDDLPQLKQALRRSQEALYIKHDWPFLRTVFDRIDLQAGERYYDFPETLNFDRIERVAVWNGSVPLPIDRGIGFEEYAGYDSENDVRADPVLRWDVRWTGTKEQIEVWPIPTTNAQDLQFIGFRKLRALIANDDVCDLDDQLIVLTAAASLTKDTDEKKEKMALANDLFITLKGRGGTGGKTYNMGAQAPTSRFGHGITVNVPRGT